MFEMVASAAASFAVRRDVARQHLESLGFESAFDGAQAIGPVVMALAISCARQAGCVTSSVMKRSCPASAA